MIVYNKTKEDFSNDILTNDIGNIISTHILAKTGNKIAPNEILRVDVQYWSTKTSYNLLCAIMVLKFYVFIFSNKLDAGVDEMTGAVRRYF